MLVGGDWRSFVQVIDGDMVVHGTIGAVFNVSRIVTGTGCDADRGLREAV